MTLVDVASLVLASAAAVRAFAPDVRAGVRRLLGAGVRVGAASLLAHDRPADRSALQDDNSSGGGR
ncbi:hypothetical protein ACVNF4_05820 [Streptomyces sp. S6]